MFKVIVGLEKSVTREELDQYTADAPDITGKTPSKVEDYLGGTIMSCRHNR
jgi:hypothetical protein